VTRSKAGRRAPTRAVWSLSSAADRRCRYGAWLVAVLYGIALLAMILGPHKIGDVFA